MTIIVCSFLWSRSVNVDTVLIFEFLLCHLLRSQLYFWASPFLVRFLHNKKCDLFFLIQPLRQSHSVFVDGAWWEFLLRAFTHLGHECQAVLSQCNEFCWNGIRTHVNSKKKMPSTGSSEEDRTNDTTSRRTVSPTRYWLSYSSPLNLLTCFSLFVY